MTVAERVVASLRAHGPKNDDELASLTGTNRHQINQVARALEKRELLKRSVGPGGKLVNVLVGDAGADLVAEPPRMRKPDHLMAEDTVKRLLYAHLLAEGYSGDVAWAHAPGIDMDVIGPGGRLIIEAKGEAASNQQQHNSSARWASWCSGCRMTALDTDWRFPTTGNTAGSRAACPRSYGSGCNWSCISWPRTAP